MSKTTHIDRLRALGIKNPIRRYLLSGRSVRDTAKALGISTVRVYEYANAHDLPTNKPIRPGSTYEKQVHALLHQKEFPLRLVARLLRTSYPHLLALKRKTSKSRPSI
jgi:hypothetical protein